MGAGKKMNLDMILVEIIGLKTDLQAVIGTLRQLGCMHIEELENVVEVSAKQLTVDPETLRKQEELSLLVAQIGGLLDVLGGDDQVSTVLPSENYLDEVRAGLNEIAPRIKSLTSQREQFESELASLPRYEAILRKLLPIIPPSVHEPGNRSVGVLIDRKHMDILDLIGKRTIDLTQGHAEVVAGDVDASTRAMLLVFPEKYANEIENLLGHEDISRLRLPAELGEGSPDIILATLYRLMASIPEQIKEINRELDHLTMQWREKLASWHAVLQDEVESSRILSNIGETDSTFVLAGWIPSKDYEMVATALKENVGNNVFFQKLKVTPEMKSRAPVILQNPVPTRPFESLVKLLALPRYGHIDPTQLMAFFLPIFFGMILGDVGYGLVAFAVCLGLMRRFKSGVMRDLLIVIAMGTGWAIVFGFLYGEVFGTLGEHLGMHPLWFSRTSSEHGLDLLIMAVDGIDESFDS